MSFAAVMLIGLLIDVAVGWPDALFRRIGHPVTWLGRLIAALDRSLNRPEWAPQTRRWLGAAALVLVVSAAALPAYALQAALPAGWLGVVLGGVLAWPLIAARSLYTHVLAVLTPLQSGDLAGARRAVAMIVGRDPEQLGAEGVSRAALESLSENSSDGVIAPLFWGALLGLPGLAGYKAVNTLDSMIGHRTARHGAFGWASARLDDVANLVPARLTGLLLASGCAHAHRSLAVMWRDAHAHRSPNAGWPEAAMAGALGVRLSGPRAYAHRISDEPWLNAGAPDPDAGDLRDGLALYRRAMGLAVALLGAVVLLGR